MSLDDLRSFLLLCTVINYGILMLWFLLLVFAHDWIFHLHRVWFKLTNEQFNVIHYAGMGIYKIGILLFNLVPLIALSVLS